MPFTLREFKIDHTSASQLILEGVCLGLHLNVPRGNKFVPKLPLLLVLPEHLASVSLGVPTLLSKWLAFNLTATQL